MSVPGVFDLSSVLYAQSQYLDDLGGYVQTAGTQANDVAVYVNNLQSKLNNLYNVYNTANQNTQQVIDKQATMSRILAAENDRLQQKQAVIDNKLVGTKRMIELNESARKRMAEYQKIIIVIVVTLILYILIIYANRFFPYVPQVWFDVFIAILFTASLIMIGNIIYRIYGRNNMNFDRIDLNPPKNATNQAKTSSGNNDGENLGDILQSALNSNQCSGQACCAVYLVR